MEKKLPNEIFFAEVERLISEGSEVRLKVKGTSMRPFLQSGKDSVVLAHLSDSQLKVGAIVLFRYNGRHILHRIVERDGDDLTIRGDSVPTVEKVRAGDVVAVVKEVIRSDGEVIKYDSRRWNRIYKGMILRKKTFALLGRIKRSLIRK